MMVVFLRRQCLSSIIILHCDTLMKLCASSGLVRLQLLMLSQRCLPLFRRAAATVARFHRSSRPPPAACVTAAALGLGCATATFCEARRRTCACPLVFASPISRLIETPPPARSRRLRRRRCCRRPPRSCSRAIATRTAARACGRPRRRPTAPTAARRRSAARSTRRSTRGAWRGCAGSGSRCRRRRPRLSRRRSRLASCTIVATDPQYVTDPNGGVMRRAPDDPFPDTTMMV